MPNEFITPEEFSKRIQRVCPHYWKRPLFSAMPDVHWPNNDRPIFISKPTTKCRICGVSWDEVHGISQDEVNNQCTG